MNFIEAPNEYRGVGLCVFLAGGISDTENWQVEMMRQLEGHNFTVLNPRRKKFAMGDTEEGQRQIDWEWRYLQRADLVAFWFPPQTLCPIALFELGACCASNKPLVVGSDLAYARRFDLEVQLSLRRPEVALHASIEAVVNEIARHPAVGGKR
jgi:hypothetical protein